MTGVTESLDKADSDADWSIFENHVTRRKKSTSWTKNKDCLVLAEKGVVLSKLITDKTALDSEVGGFYPIASAEKDNSLDSIDMPWPIIGRQAEVTDDAIAL